MSKVCILTLIGMRLKSAALSSSAVLKMSA